MYQLTVLDDETTNVVDAPLHIFKFDTGVLLIGEGGPQLSNLHKSFWKGPVVGWFEPPNNHKFPVASDHTALENIEFGLFDGVVKPMVPYIPF